MLSPILYGPTGSCTSLYLSKIYLMRQAHEIFYPFFRTTFRRYPGRPADFIYVFVPTLCDFPERPNFRSSWMLAKNLALHSA